MNLNAKLKPAIDTLLTIALLLLMSYELLGSTAHEFVGIVMFVLFVIHHILNINWVKHLTKGKKTPIRIYQNLIVLLVLISFIGSIGSGIIISRHVFTFLNINSSWTANRIHMLSVYWGFVLMSLHLGLHFNLIMSAIKKHFPIKVKIILKAICIVLFAYGIFAFVKRDIANYLFLKNQFFILGDNENLLLYILDYIFIMFSFATLSYLFSVKLKRIR